MRTVATILVFMIAASSPLTSQNSQTQSLEPLTIHCLDLPSLSVAARTPTRGYTPAIELVLTDPLGRAAGKSSSDQRIPDSSYGEINELPNHQQLHSRALAVEVCNPKEGIYQISVEEKAAEKYALVVSARNPTAGTSNSLLLHHIARNKQARNYRFAFRVENHILVLRWLDPQGHEVPDALPLEPNDW